MTVDPWLSEARQRARAQREWCLRDRVPQRTHVDVLWRGVLWAIAGRASVASALAVIGVWAMIEWLT